MKNHVLYIVENELGKLQEQMEKEHGDDIYYCPDGEKVSIQQAINYVKENLK